MLQRKSVRWMSAAVAAIVALGGFSLLSRSPRTGKGPDSWWLGPPSAWAAQINAAIDQARVKGITSRERTYVTQPDGTLQPLGETWFRFYMSRNSYRRDIYDRDFLREIQWYVPQSGGMVQTGFRNDTKTWGRLFHKGSFGDEDPVERIRFYVKMVDRADRMLSMETIDGRQCVGFEIRASKYGSNPDTWIDRIWFDVNTRLPARIEHRGRGIYPNEIDIQDQFNFSPDLPADTFTPYFPEGYQFNNSPDELLRQRRSQ